MTDNLCYGTDPDNNQEIYLNRKKMSNPHCMIMGAPGSGKIAVMKHEMCQVIKETEDDVIFLAEHRYPDVEDSGMKQIILGKDKYTINPLDVVITCNDECSEEPISRIEDICCCIAVLLSGRELLMHEHIAIAKACKIVMNPYIEECIRMKKVYDPENNPTFKDICEEVRKIDEEFYSLLNVNNTPLEIMLHHKTNVPEIDRLCISSDYDYMTKGFEALCKLTYAHNKAIITGRNKHKATWIYFEDTDIYFCPKYATAFFPYVFPGFYKRIRMDWGIATCVLSAVPYSDENFKPYLNNTGLNIFLALCPIDREWIKEYCGISTDILKDGEPGTGIIYDGKNNMRFSVRGTFPFI